MEINCIQQQAVGPTEPFVYALQCLTGKIDNKKSPDPFLYGGAYRLENIYQFYQLGTGERTQKPQ